MGEFLGHGHGKSRPWQNRVRRGHIRYKRDARIQCGPSMFDHSERIHFSKMLFIEGYFGAQNKNMIGSHTVDVISPEQTSHIYFSPPSVPRVTVFFRITPIPPE